MTMKHENHFEFVNADKAAGTTVLQAVMASFSYANHAHEELALGVTLDGIQEFSCKGSRFRSAPGNIILFNPGEVHNGNPGNNTALKYTMLYLDPNEITRLAGSAASGKRLDCRFPETNFVDRRLQSSIMTLSRLVTENTGSRIEYERSLYEIAKRLTQRMEAFHPDAWVEHKDSLLLLARDYIHDHVEDDISIEDLSRVTNISKYHFIRLFRSQFGLTPHQYILNHRINMVRLALATGSPPTDVAHRFGFFDVSHLNRRFKRSYGVTPKQYQHQLLK